jgi:hypothetical protein
MPLYSDTYPPVYYDGYGTPFPAAPLDVRLELNLAGWTGITTFAYQREGTSPPMSITRGRPDEKTTCSPAAYAGTWNNRDGRFTARNPTGPYYGLLGKNTPLRVSVPNNAVTYLRTADDNQSACSAPDATALQITGDIDIRIDLDPDDWQACTLAGKWGGSTALWAWCLTLNGDGTLTLYWYDGSNVNSASTAGLGVLPLGRSMIRAALDASTGDVSWYTAPDMAGSQTLIGTTTGAGATTVQGAAGQGIDIGYVAGFIGQGLPAGNSGLLGKVYEFALYDSSATLVADPQFTAQTPGSASFTDGQGNTWTPGGTSEVSDRSYRGHFECSSLPKRWDPAGTDFWVPVAASGVLRRLSQNNSPVLSAMRRGVTLSIASFVPGALLGYWPGEDSQGSTQIASGLPGGQPMGFSGAPGFQGQAGSPSADSVFACSAQLAQIQNSSWSFTVPGHTAGGSGDAAAFLLTIPSGTPAAELIRFDLSGGDYVALTYDTASGGNLSVEGPGLLFSGPAGVDGQAYWVQIGTTTGITGLEILAAGETASTAYTANLGFAETITGGRVNRYSAALGATEIGHLWVSNAAPSLEAFASLLSAWDGETAAARFARLCGENSLTARIYGYPDASAAMQAQQIDTLSTLLQSCEDADRGLIYEPAETLGLGYRTNASLCAQDPAVTFDYSAAHLGTSDSDPGLEPDDDDQYTLNDAILSRNNGSSYQAQVTTGPLSVLPPEEGGAGDYSTSLTVYCQTDGQLPDIAWWMTHAGTSEAERYPAIPLNLARGALNSLLSDILNTRIGDYAQIISLPAQQPPGPAKQLVYGTEEKLGGFWYLASWNAVPEDPYEVIVLDDDTLGRLDTDGATLAASVSPTATTLSVATTNPDSPLWTTDPSDCPFDIGTGGEQITVTAVTGSASPQSFTVVRSVNSVVKSQSAGASVSLFHAPVLALA